MRGMKKGKRILLVLLSTALIVVLLQVGTALAVFYTCVYHPPHPENCEGTETMECDDNTLIKIVNCTYECYGDGYHHHISCNWIPK